MDKISSLDYCRSFVRDNDYNLYLVHFFMPSDKRREGLALLALHCELKTIPHKAGDPAMAMIRLKWWYDETKHLKDDSNRAVTSPILQELSLFLKSSAISHDQIDAYFHALEQSFKGQDTDIEEPLYSILCDLIQNEEEKARFIRVLQHHDQLPDHAFLRAFRLWLHSLR